MRFELGKHGDKALDDLAALTSHPEADTIRAGVERARAVESYWEYKNPSAFNATPAAADEGPMGLELNPDDGVATDADTAPIDEPTDAE